MSVKLALLKSGETIIANISDMFSESTGNFLGYYFENPCGISLESIGESLNEDEKVKMTVRLIDWIPLSQEKKVPIVADYVVSIMDPVETLKQTFAEKYS